MNSQRLMVQFVLTFCFPPFLLLYFYYKGSYVQKIDTSLLDAYHTKTMTKIQVVQLKQEILKEIHINNNTTFSSPDVSGEFFIDYIGNFDREVFAVVGMNVKNKPTYCEICHIGVLDYSPVHFREIFKGAILANSSSIIVSHNHVSGNLEPSNEDIKITKALIEAGELLGINVLDHIIVNDTDYLSLKKDNNNWGGTLW